MKQKMIAFTNPKDVCNFTRICRAKIHEAMVDALSAESEKIYEDAIKRAVYPDDDGSIRASVGYGILRRGELRETGGVDPSFGTNGALGAESGRAFLDSLIPERSSLEIASVFVAGDVKGEIYEAQAQYDVLTGARYRMEKELGQW